MSISALPPHLLNDSIGGRSANSKPDSPDVVLSNIYNSVGFRRLVVEAVEFAQEPLLVNDRQLKEMNFGQRVQMGLGELFKSEVALKEWRDRLKQVDAPIIVERVTFDEAVWQAIGSTPRDAEGVLRSLKGSEIFKKLIRRAARESQPLAAGVAGPSYAASVRLRIGNALTSVKRVPSTITPDGKQEAATSYLDRGNFFSKEEKYKRAIAEFSVGLEKHPNSSRLYAARAQARFETEDTTRAVADYSSAIRIKPDSAYLLGRAKVWHVLGRDDLAIKDAYQARSTGKPPIWGFLSQLDALVLYGGWEEYKQLLTQEIESYKETEFYPALSALLALATNQNLPEARTLVIEAEEWPYHEAYRSSLIGEIELALGNTKAALQRFTGVVEISSGCTIGYYRRAHANWILGNFLEVKQDLEKCSAVSCQGHGEKFDAEVRLAWLLATCPEEQIRNTFSALELASNQVKDEPTPKVEALMALAAAFGNRGDFTRARKVLGRTIVLGPEAKLREILIAMDKSYAEGKTFLAAKPLPRRLFVPR